MKKLLSGILAFALIFSCTLLVGCSKPIYGKTYTYQGGVSHSWSPIDRSYGKKIEDILTNQIDNIDWSKADLEGKTFDVSGENFKKGKQVLEYFDAKYKEVVEDKINDIVITIGSKEEMKLTARKGEQEEVYNLKHSANSPNFVEGYAVKNGVEEDSPSLHIHEETDGKNIHISGADYEAKLTLPLKNAITDGNGESINEIVVNIFTLFTISK